MKKKNTSKAFFAKKVFSYHIWHQWLTIQVCLTKKCVFSNLILQQAWTNQCGICLYNSSRFSVRNVNNINQNTDSRFKRVFIAMFFASEKSYVSRTCFSDTIIIRIMIYLNSATTLWTSIGNNKQNAISVVNFPLMPWIACWPTANLLLYECIFYTWRIL